MGVSKKTMNKKTVVLGMVLWLPFAGPSRAQAPAPQAPAQILTRDDLDTLVAIARKDTLAHKADIVAKNMILDGAQASAFWPLWYWSGSTPIPTRFERWMRS